jgi:hypothetical protein
MADTQIAQTILEQLGGSRFRVMTGARDFTADGNSLIFKLPQTSTKNRIAAVKITLTPQDDYNMEFLAFRGSFAKGNRRVETVAKHEGIYCDMLQEIFTQETGLDTHL